MYPKFEDCTFKQSQPVNLPCTQLKISLPIANTSLNSAKFTKSNYPSINYAAFDDLRVLYKTDKFSIIKRAPKLTSKACWPSHLEFQNVKLDLKVLHESTAEGLSSFNHENKTSENSNS